MHTTLAEAVICSQQGRSPEGRLAKLGNAECGVLETADKVQDGTTERNGRDNSQIACNGSERDRCRGRQWRLLKKSPKVGPARPAGPQNPHVFHWRRSLPAEGTHFFSRLRGVWGAHSGWKPPYAYLPPTKRRYVNPMPLGGKTTESTSQREVPSKPRRTIDRESFNLKTCASGYRCFRPCQACRVTQ